MLFQFKSMRDGHLGLGDAKDRIELAPGDARWTHSALYHADSKEHEVEKNEINKIMLKKAIKSPRANGQRQFYWRMETMVP